MAMDWDTYLASLVQVNDGTSEFRNAGVPVGWLHKFSGVAGEVHYWAVKGGTLPGSTTTVNWLKRNSAFDGDRVAFCTAATTHLGAPVECRYLRED